MGGNLITAIPALYHQLLLPIGVIMLIVGGVSGAFSLHKGFGKAAGKVVGGIALTSLVFGGLSLANSINDTVTAGTGQYIMNQDGYNTSW